MEIVHLDHLTRTLATLFSRRTLAGALGLSALESSSLLEAKQKHRKRKKNKKPNPPTCTER